MCSGSGTATENIAAVAHKQCRKYQSRRTGSAVAHSESQNTGRASDILWPAKFIRFGGHFIRYERASRPAHGSSFSRWVPAPLDALCTAWPVIFNPDVSRTRPLSRKTSHCEVAHPHIRWTRLAWPERLCDWISSMHCSLIRSFGSWSQSTRTRA